MRQVLQSLSDGTTSLVEVPAPIAPRGGLLIRTACSLISAGTERMLLDFGRAGWIERARQQPEKVRQVLDKIRTDGLLAAAQAVRSKLDGPVPLGYCNVGLVAEVGAEVRGFAVGDRIVSNGPHAEWVAVPRNLCARVPAEVADDEAVFTVLGAIALQGVRLGAPTLGESFAVIGLGLIGLLTVQLLRANGCRVLGIDPDTRRRTLAQQFGAEVIVPEGDVLAAAARFSQGLGMDGVLITAATASNEPITQAARMCRKRGRIVLVGVSGLTLERADFYEKELSFQVSCSYGPGRYDPDYEERGNDYPAGFVRWTEQRNFNAVLEMMRARQLDARPLITHRFAFEAAPDAYELLATRAEPYIGILLEYLPQKVEELAASQAVSLGTTRPAFAPNAAPRVAFIGAGNYAARVLIPAFAGSGARLCAIASAGGITAAHCARKFGVPRVTTDATALIGAEDLDLAVIATRHDTHAQFAVQALQSGKHVFVEKPLAVAAAQIDAIVDAWEKARAAGRQPLLTVGFNRRFAPQVLRIRRLLEGIREPKALIATVNAGALTPEHWIRDPRIGGGRIVGEACHFVDVLRFLAGHAITDASVQRLGAGQTSQAESVDITLRFEDGSLGTIHYLANGHRGLPKERLEVFCAGRVLQLDNFRRLRGYGWPGFRTMNLWRQDKGQKALVQAFVNAVRTGGDPPIPFAELIEVSRIVITLAEAAQR
jgi:predicted dehydrogenase/threonine dehydrogenase-like Zn-dependent dehydrogenase